MVAEIPDLLSPTPKAGGNIRTLVTPETVGKSQLCHFNIYNIFHSSELKIIDEFTVVLVTSRHGIFDLVDAIYKHSLTKATSWDIDSHSWRVEYGDKTYYNSVDSTAGKSSKTQLIHVNTNEPRLFNAIDGDASIPVQEGTRGHFNVEHKPLSFDFKLDCVQVKDVEAEDYPKCVKTFFGCVFTSNPKQADFVNAETLQKVEKFRKLYKEFYNGENAWKKKNCHSRDFVPRKPVHPDWSRAEYTIMALFMNSTMKFSKSWNSGLKFALIHRSESSVKAKWYEKHIYRYMLGFDGEGLKQDEKIIRAKKLCKAMMEEILDYGPPQPTPKPVWPSRKKSFDELDGQGSDVEENPCVSVSLDYVPKCILRNYKVE